MIIGFCLILTHPGEPFPEGGSENGSPFVPSKKNMMVPKL